MKAKNNELITVLSSFITDYLPNSKGLSKNTVVAYSYAFRLLFEYLEKVKGIAPDQATFDTFTTEVIEEFLLHLEKERKCSVRTRNIRRAALVAFSKYAAKKAFTSSLPLCSAMANIDKKKEPARKSIKYFTKEEITLLLKLPDTATTIGQRDLTLLSLLYSSGARAQELCDIRLCDITLATPSAATTVRLTGKGNKSRVVTIPDNCSNLLKEYLRSRHLSVDDTATQAWHAFSSQTNEHMTIACIEEIVNKYVTMAKKQYPTKFRQRTYTPHSFRHSIAVHMLEAGDSLVAIKAFLGHVSIATTIIYADVTPELANKYLDERGKPVHTAPLVTKPQPLPYAMPFLYGK